MENKKTISISVIITLILSMGLNVGLDQLKLDEYVCEDRIEMGSYPCSDFTQYYGLENGKCINTDTGNKLCRTGWVKIINETNIDKKTGNTILKYKGREWTCDSDESNSICTRNGTHQAYRYQLN